MNSYQPLISGAFALLGVLIGAAIQYVSNLRINKRASDLNARSDLYKELFSQLRNAGNDTIEVNALLCDAQIYASDDVLDILEDIDARKGLPPDLLHDLLIQIRKELRPKSKIRKLRIYVYDRESGPNQSSKRTR